MAIDIAIDWRYNGNFDPGSRKHIADHKRYQN